MVKFRQSCCESEAPRPERIISWKSTVCNDIIIHWLEHQSKEGLTSRKKTCYVWSLIVEARPCEKVRNYGRYNKIIASLRLCAGSVMQVFSADARGTCPELVRRRGRTWTIAVNHAFPADYSYLLSVLLAWYFDCAQHKSKSTKRSRLTKNGWKQASILAGRNEGCYFIPLLKTDVQKSLEHHPPFSHTFLLYLFAACFLNAIFGRPVLSKLLHWYC